MICACYLILTHCVALHIVYWCNRLLVRIPITMCTPCDRLLHQVPYYVTDRLYPNPHRDVHTMRWAVHSDPYHVMWIILAYASSWSWILVCGDWHILLRDLMLCDYLTLVGLTFYQDSLLTMYGTFRAVPRRLERVGLAQLCIFFIHDLNI